jgi:hypothetical protein
MSKFELASLLFAKMDKSNARMFKSTDGKTYIGWLVAVTKEDGSGSSFNLLVNGCNNVKYSFHIRTID